MKFTIKPETALNICEGGATTDDTDGPSFGRLESFSIDFSKTSMLGIPRFQLAISVNKSAMSEEALVRVTKLAKKYPQLIDLLIKA